MTPPSAEPEKCSATTAHPAHTYGGRPMHLCKGIPRPDCDGSVVRATGQCNSCLAYHDAAHSTPPAPAETPEVYSDYPDRHSCSICEPRRPVAAPPPQPRQPDGYAYRYGDGCIRFNHGQQVNGGDPIEVIPYFFAHPSTHAEPSDERAEFEKWAESEGLPIGGFQLNNGQWRYERGVVNARWIGWQARAPLERREFERLEAEAERLAAELKETNKRLALAEKLLNDWTEAELRRTGGPQK